MKVAIMQPYFFPYIGYWQLVSVVDLFVIYDDVNYINRGFVNRNSILLNGKPFRITLELLAASQNKLINQIHLGRNRQKLLKTIRHAYARAPHFNKVMPLLEETVSVDESNLAKFLGASIAQTASYLGLKAGFVYSSDIQRSDGLLGQDKIVEICKRLGASTYINRPGGEMLYDRGVFAQAGIELKFMAAAEKAYLQGSQTFVPNLSIIDAMMFNSQSTMTRLVEH